MGNITFIPEQTIEALVLLMPEVRLNSKITRKPKFGSGDKFELGRYIQKKENFYPLIWMLPSNDGYVGRGQSVNKTCEFIVATREANKDLFNSDRYNKNFKNVLRPTTDILITALKKSTLTTVISNDFGVFKYPNYSEADKNFTVDLWDALTLTIEVNIKDKDKFCLKPILFT